MNLAYYQQLRWMVTVEGLVFNLIFAPFSSLVQQGVVRAVKIFDVHLGEKMETQLESHDHFHDLDSLI